MICHYPDDMKRLALTGLDNDVRKTLMWAADHIKFLELRLLSAESHLRSCAIEDAYGRYLKDTNQPDDRD